MKWSITSETIRRQVTFKIEDAEPTMARPWGWDEEYQMKPDTAVVVVVDGERQGLVLLGPRLLKDGRPSENKRTKARWDHRDMSEAPAWIRELYLQVVPR